MESEKVVELFPNPLRGLGDYRYRPLKAMEDILRRERDKAEPLTADDLFESLEEQKG